MSISYDKLWKLLIDNKMTKTDLRIKADISTATLAKLSKQQPVSMNVMMRICNALKCDVLDILEFIQD